MKAFWFLEKPLQPGVMRTLLERAVAIWWADPRP
jgi:hypothetical protein